MTSKTLLVCAIAVAIASWGCGKDDKKAGNKSKEAPTAKKPLTKEQRQANARIERGYLRRNAIAWFKESNRDIAEVRVRAVAAAWGVTPTQAVDALVKGEARVNGKVVKAPTIAPDKINAKPDTKALIAEQDRIRALPEAERVAAVLKLVASNKLTPENLLGAAYALKTGQKPGDHAGLVAEMKLILAMEGAAMRDANLDFSLKCGLDTLQIIELTDAIKKQQ